MARRKYQGILNKGMSVRNQRRLLEAPGKHISFGLETYAVLLAQTHRLIDLCTGMHECIMFSFPKHTG